MTTFFITSHLPRPARRGAVLLVVTVVLLLVSVTIVGLITLMQTDLRATRMRGDEMILENTLRSAEEVLIAWAQLSRDERTALGGISKNGELFRHQSLIPSEDNDEACFTTLLPNTFGPDEPLIFGAVNESSKLNLHVLLEWELQQPGRGEQALMELPGMSSATAASIMDWLDSDSISRSSGAEAEQYASAGKMGLPANRVPNHIDELIQVKSTSRFDWISTVSADHQDTFGEQPTALSDQHLPWDQFLTVHSRERNESTSGQPRVFLNDDNLIRLHGRLTSRINQPVADFVVLYRQFGPVNGLQGKDTDSFEVDFSLPAKFQFESELELVGSSVVFQASNRQWLRFDSPLSADRNEWSGQLESLMDKVTVDPRPVIEGRINVDQAPREVLLAIPGMDPATADQILSFRQITSDGQKSHIHPTWLLEQGVVDLAIMKELLPYLTTGGEVYQAQIVAYFPNRKYFLREVVLVDGTGPGRGRLYCKDLRDTECPFDITTLLPSRTRNETKN